MAKYANIIIDISHEKLDKTFQYRIPPEMKDEITEGMQVIVPFGNRTIKGYVLELTDKAEFDTAKLKDIKAVDSNAMQIESQFIALAAWMRKNYGGTMNQALKTVIPIKEKAKEKKSRLVRLMLPFNEAASLLEELKRKHRTARARLLEALLEETVLSYDVITKKLHITADVIKAMVQQGVITVEEVRTYRNPVRTQEMGAYTLTLNEMQQKVVDAVIENARTEKKPCLIHGVTGSGKTEVYMELIAEAAGRGKQSIVLIPEIALTYQTVMRFYHRFGDRVSIMNSKLSPGERSDQFERAKKGEIDVMIGPRSALFTPFSNLGYIIIDEEHEGTYKSETIPRYHARETAIERARMSGATVILGSATPSIESFYHAKKGDYLLLSMDKRVKEKPLPECEIVDLREELKARNFSILSRSLHKKIEQRLLRKEQVMLFINRRGMAGFVSCRACGHVMKCPHCDVSLHAHNNGKLICHYCGYEQNNVKICPSCGSKYISGFKAGTQKIEELVKKEFPEARILRMDFDTTRSKDSYEKILSAFANQEADILIGTQMIVKGHDFPNVTLVGVLAADLSLYVSDYHAAERTFQLLTQAAGRAGRGEKPGEVIIQTYNPEHYSVICAKNQDYNQFYEEEIFYRQAMRYPPVWHMLVVLCASKEEAEAYACAKELADTMEKVQADKKLQMIGPADAAVARVNDIYKKVLYFKHPDYGVLIQIKDKVEQLMEEKQGVRNVSVQFDFDPVNGF